MGQDDTNYEEALAALRSLSVEDRKRAFSTLKRAREDQMESERTNLAPLPNTHWSKADLLQRLPNPSEGAYEQKILIPELTFVGVANQPDFGEMLITFYPQDWTIELKSLKTYKDAFRDSVVSYERIANVVYDDLRNVYEPERLRVMLRMRPRGGISSCLTIDSDWIIRGGKEQFKDWVRNVDHFGFESHTTQTIL
jgi:7-cyano-7-deazaguanine reductase